MKQEQQVHIQKSKDALGRVKIFSHFSLQALA